MLGLEFLLSRTVSVAIYEARSSLPTTTYNLLVERSQTQEGVIKHALYN